MLQGFNNLNDLFNDVGKFRKSEEAKKLFDFIAGFPSLAPFNALLVHIQRPGSRMVATADTWNLRYGRRIKFDARPLVILWPFGPVNFVFDIADTEETPDSMGKEIPELAINPLKCEGKLWGHHWHNLTGNLPGLGILASMSDTGSHMGGSIQPVNEKYFQRVDSCKEQKYVKVIYGIKLGRCHDRVTVFSILAHELGHLFCGHFYARHIHDSKMPERGDLLGLEPGERKIIEEFEAATVSWLVCKRLGIKAPADVYLSSYLRNNEELPKVDLEIILKAANRIESFYKVRHAPRLDLLMTRSELESGLYKLWENDLP